MESNPFHLCSLGRHYLLLVVAAKYRVGLTPQNKSMLVGTSCQVAGLSSVAGEKITTLWNIIPGTYEGPTSSSVVRMAEVLGHVRMGRVFRATLSNDPTRRLIAKVLEVKPSVEYTAKQIYAAALHEARLYTTNLLPLQGTWVPCFYGLFAARRDHFGENNTWVMLLSDAGDYALGGDFDAPAPAVREQQ